MCDLCSDTGPILKGLVLSLMFYHCHLEILNTFEKASYFHFALGPQIIQLGLSTWLPPFSLPSDLYSGVLFAKRPFLATLLKIAALAPAPHSLPTSLLKFPLQHMSPSVIL